MDEGEYDKELLISGWNHGNEFAFSTFLGEPKNQGTLLCLPSAKLMKIWTWNRNRKALQAQHGELKFVPRISFIRRNQDVLSVVVWPDGIPSVVPPVDCLIVLRQALAPRRFLGRAEDRTLLSWEKARELFERHGSRQPGDAILLDYDRAPRDVVRFIRSLPGGNGKISMVTVDQVLDRELVDKHLR
jgi:hypothetical protein